MFSQIKIEGSRAVNVGFRGRDGGPGLDRRNANTDTTQNEKFILLSPNDGDSDLQR